jgi:predicted dienelactone hydrolase
MHSPKSSLRTRWKPTSTGWRRGFAAVGLAIGLFVLAACNGAAVKSSPTTQATSANPSTTVAPTTTTFAPRRTFAVGRRSVTLVDTSRPTAADPTQNVPAKPSRTLPVLVLYPAVGTPAADGTPIDNLQPAPGRYPLVMFSHGFEANGPLYSFVLQKWVQAGFIVAAPTVPLSSGAKSFADTVALGDYQNQPADVSFVLTSILDGQGGTDFITQHVDPHRIAAAGHSLGAITTLGLVYNSCCIDHRINAAISLSGIELPFPNGSFTNPPATPLLLVHGAADKTVPIAPGSDTIFKVAKPPVYFLRFRAAGHVDVVSSTTYRPFTDQAVIAFLDAELHHGGPALLRHMPTVIAQSGLGTWEQKLH